MASWFGLSGGDNESSTGNKAVVDTANETAASGDNTAASWLSWSGWAVEKSEEAKEAKRTDSSTSEKLEPKLINIVDPTDGGGNLLKRKKKTPKTKKRESSGEKKGKTRQGGGEIEESQKPKKKKKTIREKDKSPRDMKDIEAEIPQKKSKKTKKRSGGKPDGKTKTKKKRKSDEGIELAEERPNRSNLNRFNGALEYQNQNTYDDRNQDIMNSGEDLTKLNSLKPLPSEPMLRVSSQLPSREVQLSTHFSSERFPLSESENVTSDLKLKGQRSASNLIPEDLEARGSKNLSSVHQALARFRNSSSSSNSEKMLFQRLHTTEKQSEASNSGALTFVSDQLEPMGLKQESPFSYVHSNSLSKLQGEPIHRVASDITVNKMDSFVASHPSKSSQMKPRFDLSRLPPPPPNLLSLPAPPPGIEIPPLPPGFEDLIFNALALNRSSTKKRNTKHREKNTFIDNGSDEEKNVEKKKKTKIKGKDKKNKEGKKFKKAKKKSGTEKERESLEASLETLKRFSKVEVPRLRLEAIQREESHEAKVIQEASPSSDLEHVQEKPKKEKSRSKDKETNGLHETGIVSATEQYTTGVVGFFQGLFGEESQIVSGAKKEVEQSETEKEREGKGRQKQTEQEKETKVEKDTKVEKKIKVEKEVKIEKGNKKKQKTQKQEKEERKEGLTRDDEQQTPGLSKLSDNFELTNTIYGPRWMLARSFHGLEKLKAEEALIEFGGGVNLLTRLQQVRSRIHYAIAHGKDHIALDYKTPTLEVPMTSQNSLLNVAAGFALLNCLERSSNTRQRSIFFDLWRQHQLKHQHKTISEKYTPEIKIRKVAIRMFSVLARPMKVSFQRLKEHNATVLESSLLSSFSRLRTVSVDEPTQIKNWRTIGGGSIIFEELEENSIRVAVPLPHSVKQRTLASATFDWLRTEPDELQKAVKRLALDRSYRKRETY